MTIDREQLGAMNFADLADTGEDGMDAPVSPGEILREEFMRPLELSAAALARALHVPANRVTGLLNEQRGITADTALRLARYFGTTPEFWMRLQAEYELRRARRAAARINREVSPRVA